MQEVGADVERTANAPGAEDAMPVDDPGFVDFAVAGASVVGEFRCADCWYGAVVQRELPSCPMCGGTVWERRASRFVD